MVALTMYLSTVGLNFVTDLPWLKDFAADVILTNGVRIEALGALEKQRTFWALNEVGASST